MNNPVPSRPTLVRIRHGDLWRGGRLVLRGAELEIPFPSVVGLIGANGAGKSTLLHSMAHVLGAPERVRIALDDRAHHTTALVPQTPALPTWLTLDELLPLSHATPEAAAITAELNIDLLRSRRAGTYSAGQRQAVALAVGLASAEAIILLDEPLSHLDMRSRACVAKWIRKTTHQGDGAVTFVSSHSPTEIGDLCDWIVAIRHGEYSFSGPKGRLVPGAVPSDGNLGASRLERRMLDLV